LQHYVQLIYVFKISIFGLIDGKRYHEELAERIVLLRLWNKVN
jgi:hypothetical protein